MLLLNSTFSGLMSLQQQQQQQQWQQQATLVTA
jgi:hypothetical protein